MTAAAQPPIPAVAAPSAAALPAAVPPRLPALDGVRGAAILLVLGHHLGQGQLHRSAWLDPAVQLSGYGWIGVDLFFVLSGFLITGILLRTRGRPGYFLNFYARRTLRIFPLYFGVLAVVLVVLPALGVALERTPAPPSDAWHWLYGTNLLIALRGSWDTGLVLFPFTHFWSLAVEEHFYLLWPLLIAFTPARHAGLLCLAAVAGAFGLRAAFYLLSQDWIAAYVWTPFRIDALAAGGFAAVLFAGTSDRAALGRRAGRVFAAALGGIAVAALATSAERSGGFVPTVGYTLLAVAFAALVLRVATLPAAGRWDRLCAHPVLRWFGRYSYGLYVFHVFAIAGVEALRSRWPAAFGGHVAVEIVVSRTLMLALTTGAAWASWNFFERRFTALKTRFE